MPKLSLPSVFVPVLFVLTSCATPPIQGSAQAEPASVAESSNRAATNSEPGTAQQVNDRTVIGSDEYRNAKWVTGPVFAVPRAGYCKTKFQLRSLWLGGDAPVLHLYVSDSDYDWRFYDHANDRDGNELPLTKAGTNVVTVLANAQCYEDVAVELTRQYLESHLSSGMSIKVWGNGGERVVDVPAFYVEGFLRRLGEHVANVATSSPTAETANQ